MSTLEQILDDDFITGTGQTQIENSKNVVNNFVENNEKNLINNNHNEIINDNNNGNYIFNLLKKYY